MHFRIKQILIGILLLLNGLANAQPPVSFPYQAVIRNSEGQIFADKIVKIKVSIYFDDNEDNPVFVETHSLVTNFEGVAALSIGYGTPVQSTLGEVEWGSGSIAYLKVEVDINNTNDFVLIGATPIMSAPYALHSYHGLQNINGAEGQVMVRNNNLWSASDKITALPDGVIIDGQGVAKSGIFTVQNSAGETLFAVNQSDVTVSLPDNTDNSYFDVAGIDGTNKYLHVTPDSTNIGFDDTNNAAGTKGGFAVGGLSSGKATTQTSYFTLSPDGAGFFFDQTAFAAGTKGGFAVGGLSSGKATGNDLFIITPDSTRMYLSGDYTQKSSKGGFAVGGLSSGKKQSLFDILTITPQETRFVMEPLEIGGGALGGLAIGGYPNNENNFIPFFNLTPDSTVINTGSTTASDIETEGDVNLEGDVNYLPKLQLNEIINILKNSAEAQATIVSNMGTPIETYGLVWSVNPNPTLENNTNSTTESGDFTGQFSGTITGLQSGTVYYVKAYAANTVGTAYSNALQFTTRDENALMPTITFNSFDTVYNDRFVVNIKVEPKGMTRGFVFSKAGDPAPTITNFAGISYGVDTSASTSTISTDHKVEGGTAYQVRAFVTYQESEADKVVSTTIYSETHNVTTPLIKIQEIQYEFSDVVGENEMHIDFLVQPNDLKPLNENTTFGLSAYIAGMSNIDTTSLVFATIDDEHEIIRCTVDENIYIQDTYQIIGLLHIIDDDTTTAILESPMIETSPTDMTIKANVFDIYPTGATVGAEVANLYDYDPLINEVYFGYFARFSTSRDMSNLVSGNGDVFEFEMGQSSGEIETPENYMLITKEQGITLQPDTYYYVNVQAKLEYSDIITSYYSDTVQFHTPSAANFGVVEDIDGNKYPTQFIGQNNWMLKDLKTKHYANGDAIDAADYKAAEFGDGNNLLYRQKTIYEFLATGGKQLCPQGWRVAKYEDYYAIITDSINERARYLKDTTSGVWPGGDVNPLEYPEMRTNFAAVPSGKYSYDTLPEHFYNGGAFYMPQKYDFKDVYDEYRLQQQEQAEYRTFNLFKLEHEIVNYYTYYTDSNYYAIRCVEAPVQNPTISYYRKESSADSAIFVCNILNKGNHTKGTVGLVWDTIQEPVIVPGYFVPTDINAESSLDYTIDDLEMGKTYYIRAFFTDASEVTYYYPKVIEFEILPVRTVMDADSNQYKTVKIGSLWWMAENLKTTRFNTNTKTNSYGKTLDVLNTSPEWKTKNGDDLGNPEKLPACCSYGFNPDNEDKYGLLYNKTAVESDTFLCPQGWRIPTNAEWTALISEYNNGNLITESDTTNWKPDSTQFPWAPTDALGFKARPGGYVNDNGEFNELNKTGCWWTSDDYYYKAEINYDSGDVNTTLFKPIRNNNPSNFDRHGFSIRCVKDAE